MSTLVMAGSLVQVPPLVAESTATHGGQGDGGNLLQRWRRFRILAAFLHVVCRLVVVSATYVVCYLAKPKTHKLVFP